MARTISLIPASVACCGEPQLGQPRIADLAITLLHRRPRYTMRDFFLSRVVPVSVPRVIEGFAINVLRVRRQMAPDPLGKIGIG